MSERLLAAELERALVGGPAGDEARALAALLVAAADPSTFEIARADVDAALARTTAPARRRFTRPFRIGAIAAAAAAAAALFFPHGAGQGVQARAAVAVDATYFVNADVVPARPGLFPATEVTGYVDGRHGRAHMDVFSHRGARRRDGAAGEWQRGAVARAHQHNRRRAELRGTAGRLRRDVRPAGSLRAQRREQPGGRAPRRRRVRSHARGRSRRAGGSRVGLDLPAAPHRVAAGRAPRRHDPVHRLAAIECAFRVRVEPLAAHRREGGRVRRPPVGACGSNAWRPLGRHRRCAGSGRATTACAQRSRRSRSRAGLLPASRTAG